MTGPVPFNQLHRSPHRPRVVVVRPTDVETDSRAKKLALSLDRLGYEVIVLGRSGTGVRREGTLGGARVTMVVPKSPIRHAPRRLVRLPSRPGRLLARFVNKRLQRIERKVDKYLRRFDRGGSYMWYVAQRDFRATYGAELMKLYPDVVHVHDPRLLPVAFRAAERMARRTGHRCEVVYDSRENFAGVPHENISLPRYHQRLLEHEAALAPRLAGVLTVSQDTADALQERLHTDTAPVVVLNAPVHGVDVDPHRSLRADCGVDEVTPLMVYQGAATAPRGVDTMVEALPLLPGVHCALVVVPYPHPRDEHLRAKAAELGVSDRLHLLPPVPADSVPHYLAEADVAVSPILRGPANHEAALPNKLFEMLHSGLPIVSSDIRAMSAFVKEHGLGVVFSSGDPADLARAVQEVLADPARWRDAPHRGDLLREWSWQAQEPALQALYSRVAPIDREPDRGPFPPVHVEWAWAADLDAVSEEDELDVDPELDATEAEGPLP